MISICYGNEEYLKNEWKEKFLGLETDEMGKDVFFTLEDAYNFISTPSFFTTRKRAVCYVDDLKALDNNTFKRYVKDTRNKTAQGELLIIIGDVKVGSKQFKDLSTTCQMLPCLKLQNETKLLQKLSEILIRENANFTEGAKRLLLKRLDYLHNEEVTLLTISNYVGQLKYLSDIVDESDILQNVPDLQTGNQWNIAKILKSRDINALDAEMRKLDRGTDSNGFSLLGMLFREYRTAYKISLGYSLKDIGAYKPPTLQGIPDNILLHGMEIISDTQDKIRTGIFNEKSGIKFCLANLMNDMICGR